MSGGTNIAVTGVTLVDCKNNNIETQKLISHQNYFNPFEYKIQNKRGYNILTNKSQTVSEGNKYLSEIQESKLTTDWDKLKNNSDKEIKLKKNKTFTITVGKPIPWQTFTDKSKSPTEWAQWLREQSYLLAK